MDELKEWLKQCHYHESQVSNRQLFSPSNEISMSPDLLFNPVWIPMSDQ